VRVPQVLLPLEPSDRLLVSRSERGSHSRTFTVLSSGQMPNVYNYILYTITVVFLTFGDSRSGSLLPGFFERLGDCGNFATTSLFQFSASWSPPYPLYISLGIYIALLRPRGTLQEPGRENPLWLRYATTNTQGYDLVNENGIVLLLGPCH
jgi:hypothetical protein